MGKWHGRPRYFTVRGARQYGERQEGMLERRSRSRVDRKPPCQGCHGLAVPSTRTGEDTSITHFHARARGPPRISSYYSCAIPCRDRYVQTSSGEESDDATWMRSGEGGRGAPVRFAPGHRESHSKTAHSALSQIRARKSSAPIRPRSGSALGWSGMAWNRQEGMTPRMTPSTGWG